MHDVADQFVVLVPAVGHEPDVAVGAVDVGAPGEHRHHARHVAVADVILLPRRPKDDTLIVIVACRGQQHVGVVDVGAVLTLGKPECHHAARFELGGGAFLGLDVVALPDRPEAQDGDLLGVPVGQAVEPEDLAQRGIARGVPPLVRIARAVFRRGEEGREDPFSLDQVEEVRHPRRLEVVGKQLRLAAFFEPVDHGAQLTSRFGVELRRVVSVRIEQQSAGVRHGVPLSSARVRVESKACRTFLLGVRHRPSRTSSVQAAGAVSTSVPASSGLVSPAHEWCRSAPSRRRALMTRPRCLGVRGSGEPLRWV